MRRHNVTGASSQDLFGEMTQHSLRFALSQLRLQKRAEHHDRRYNEGRGHGLAFGAGRATAANSWIRVDGRILGRIGAREHVDTLRRDRQRRITVNVVVEIALQRLLGLACEPGAHGEVGRTAFLVVGSAAAGSSAIVLLVVCCVRCMGARFCRRSVRLERSIIAS